MKTIVQFDLIKFSDDNYVVDPHTLYIWGFINSNLLAQLLTDVDYHKEMGIEETNKPKTITMKVWEDSDDYKTWLDFELLTDDYELTVPD